MRRRFLVLVLVGLRAAVGCGFGAIATGGLDAPPDGGADSDGGGLRADGGGLDGSTSGDAAADAPIDAEADRPDAGVPFTPTHILPVYSLTAADVAITAPSEIDTSSGTIALNGAMAVLSADIVMTNGVAVWSVGALTVDAKLSVIGGQPLVIVAARDVTINATVLAYGDLAKPGPGGSLPTVGAGKGANGAKTASDAAGGGGAGHGTVGAAGGDKAAVTGGLAGPAVNAGDSILIGGAGGGNGGGFAPNICADRGRGGAGGGAVQISAVGKIIVTFAGGIDVGGGGGSGGCKDNTPGDAFTGGGGGGAGGLVVLESVGGIQVDVGSVIEASGGGGGEGGDKNAYGTAGESGLYPTGAAQGGFGTAGGNGGAGGVGGPLVSAPVFGSAGGDTGGGGGGATGRAFLRTRGAAGLILAGTVAAERTDDPTF